MPPAQRASQAELGGRKPAGQLHLDAAPTALGQFACACVLSKCAAKSGRSSMSALHCAANNKSISTLKLEPTSWLRTKQVACKQEVGRPGRLAAALPSRSGQTGAELGQVNHMALAGLL